MSLYRDAILHALGGSEHFIDSVAIHRNGRVVGSQKVLSLSKTVALKLSAISKSRKSYETHLGKLIASSNLTAVQWLNFGQGFIELRTIQ